MSYKARILKDSVNHHGVRLTTAEITFPRIVLAEFNTHRVFSRNSASSRAIPVATMLKRMKEDPFVPVYWGKNQKGMQAAEELSPEAQKLALKQWMRARNNAIRIVERLQQPDIDLHKQIANRLLEPFLWHTVIVTATEWDNWRGLRCSKEAQPEIRKIADILMELIDENSPSVVDFGDWHLPLVDDLFDLQVAGFKLIDIVKICIGRCARVSYLTHDGKRDPQADIDLCERLLKSGHMSPFEHAARPMTEAEAMQINLNQLRTAGTMPPDVDVSKVFSGNFRAWTQARKLILHEDNFLKVGAGPRGFELHDVG